MFVRAYFRSSTDERNANRARQQVKAFVAEHGLSIAAFYVENESGATLACPGDILLVEQVDRLSRLNAAD
jgi:DNA invertase Pin-like site-specific DNA recombinase